MTRTSCHIAAWVMLLCGGLWDWSFAAGYPFSLEVDPSQSKLSIGFSGLGGAATGASTATLSSLKSIDGADGLIDVNAPGNVPGNGTLGGVGFDLSDTTVVIPLGFLGDTIITSVKIHASLDLTALNAVGPFLNGNPGQNSYDLSGVPLVLDSGEFTYPTRITSIGPEDVGYGRFQTPIYFSLPAGTLASAKVSSPRPGGGRGMTLTIPVNTSTTVTTNPIQLDMSLVGQIVLTSVVVPEPGAAILLAMGLLGLWPLLRRRR